MTLDEVTGELVPVRADLVTAAPVAAVVANQAAYYALCEALLDESDYQSIGKGRFKKKSAWTKLAAAFNVSTEVVDDIEVRDEADHLVRAKFRVRATAPNGRSATRTGVATRADSFSPREHDIVATAETRATNRACSALFGLGEVSAEEADSASERAEVDHVGRRERQAGQRTVAVSVDPSAEQITEREDNLSAEELDGYLAEIERRNLRSENRSVRRAKAKMLDQIEATRPPVSHYDPDATSPYD
jgi:hypothetical protein